MTMKGYNFTGLGDYAGLMQKGYQDYLDLYNKDRAMGIQQQQVDYNAPKETIIPRMAAQALSQDPMQVLANAYQSGVQQAPARQLMTPALMNRATGQMTPPQMIPSQNDRMPQSEPTVPEQEPPVQQDDQEINQLAKQLGLQVKDGQLVAKGKQGEQFLQLYEKLIGSAASIYGNATRGAVQGPTFARVEGFGSPAKPSARGQTELDRLKVLERSYGDQVNKLSGKPFLNSLEQVQLFRTQKDLDGVRQKLQNLSTGRKPQSKDASQQMPANKAFSPSKNKTYIFNAQGAVIGVEDGDTR